MKVYIIFDREGWEIHGIEKCFDSKEKAINYFEQFRPHFEKIKPRQNFDEYMAREIVEIEVT